MTRWGTAGPADSLPAIAPHDGQVAVIVELHLQVVLVDEVVVATAQQHKIAQAEFAGAVLQGTHLPGWT